MGGEEVDRSLKEFPSRVIESVGMWQKVEIDKEVGSARIGTTDK